MAFLFSFVCAYGHHDILLQPLLKFHPSPFHPLSCSYAHTSLFLLHLQQTEGWYLLPKELKYHNYMCLRTYHQHFISEWYLVHTVKFSMQPYKYWCWHWSFPRVQELTHFDYLGHLWIRYVGPAAKSLLHCWVIHCHLHCEEVDVILASGLQVVLESQNDMIDFCGSSQSVYVSGSSPSTSCHVRSHVFSRQGSCYVFINKCTQQLHLDLYQSLAHPTPKASNGHAVIHTSGIQFLIT